MNSWSGQQQAGARFFLQNNNTLLKLTRQQQKQNNKLGAGHSTECITHAGHAIALMHFVTL